MVRSFKAGYRRQGEHLFPNLVSKLDWMYTFAQDMQEIYSSRSEFERCGYKFGLEWEGSHRRGMSSDLLKFLADGDEGVNDLEALYEVGNITCNKNVIIAGSSSAAAPEQSQASAAAASSDTGGHVPTSSSSQSRMFLPRAADGSLLAAASSPSTSASAQTLAPPRPNCGTFGFTEETRTPGGASSSSTCTPGGASSSGTSTAKKDSCDRRAHCVSIRECLRIRLEEDFDKTPVVPHHDPLQDAFFMEGGPDFYQDEPPLTDGEDDEEDSIEALGGGEFEPDPDWVPREEEQAAVNDNELGGSPKSICAKF